MARRLLIAVVDDDESVRDSLPDLLREFGFAVEPFSSALEFLASNVVSRTDCLILDVAMPGMSGLTCTRSCDGAGTTCRPCSSPRTSTSEFGRG